MKPPTWLWSASLEQVKAGYLEDEDHYTCLCCGKQFEKGVIYPEGDTLYEAGRYTRLHIERVHRSVFHHLISLDKSVTGLSEIQRNLLLLMFDGESDAEIQKALGIGAASTVRNHRFILKEKERQARVFLAVMELLRQEERQMDRKRELKQLAKETKAEAGVYQIKNTQNGKVFVESTPNLKTINGRRFTLEMGSHMNKALQQEWNEYGPDAFAFDVLEVLEKKETAYFDVQDELEKLKQKWLDRLQPFGERGYNG